jgi:predicted dehydrogenase
METQNRLRIGIIGIGMYAVRRHVPHLRATGRAEIVAISRRTAAALEQAQKTLRVPQALTDWHHMLDRTPLDAVVVSTAHHVHAEPTVAALERGLHVLVEKPMALTAEDAWAMVAAAEQHDRVLMVGYNLRCTGLWRTVKRALDDGIIGTVRQVNLAVAYNLTWFWESQTIAPYMQERLKAFNMHTFLTAEQLPTYWRRDPAAMGGGMFADAGSHWVDLTLWLGGAPPQDVVALTESVGLTGPTGQPVDRVVSVQARLANGVLLTIAAADGIADPVSRLALYGDQGTLTADWTDTTQVWVHRDGQREPLAADLPDTNPAAAFVNTILDGTPNLAPRQTPVPAPSPLPRQHTGQPDKHGSFAPTSPDIANGDAGQARLQQSRSLTVQGGTGDEFTERHNIPHTRPRDPNPARSTCARRRHRPDRQLGL